jgi:hypothetical protein
MNAVADPTTSKPWLSKAEVARLTGLPVKKIGQLATLGYLEQRAEIEGLPARYSLSSALALRDQIVTKATRLDVFPASA